MNDFRKLLDLVDSLSEDVMTTGDGFYIECGDTLIETTIMEVTEDGVVLHLDETALRILVGDTEQLQEGKTGPGLWANIHAKRERIKHGSGERMRKPGSSGAPTDTNIRAAQAGSKNESVDEVTEDSVDEAKYHGRTVPLNKPFLTPDGPKKRSVYVKDPSTGNIKKVNFGDKNMRIKKSIPGRRKNFRARHNCDNPGPKTKARYWSCRAW